MLRLSLSTGRAPYGRLSLVAIGAHPDDIEIGCGGTLLSLAEAHPGSRAVFSVMTGSGERREESIGAAPHFFPGCDVAVEVHGLPDGRLPGHWSEVKQHLEDLAAVSTPDVVLAPRADDAHQDHRLLGELVHTVWRDHLVLEYEIPKYDGDLGSSSVYVPLTEAQAREKASLLAKWFPSQAGRDWFDDDMFLGLARLRGMECRQLYAEAFRVRKMALRW